MANKQYVLILLGMTYLSSAAVLSGCQTTSEVRGKTQSFAYAGGGSSSGTPRKILMASGSGSGSGSGAAGGAGGSGSSSETPRKTFASGGAGGAGAGGAGGGGSGGGGAGAGGAGAGGAGAGGAGGGSGGGGWSDRRLKTRVRRIGTSPSGLPVYAFTYLWGGPEMVGVMAQDLLILRPDAIITSDSGYLMVDYDRIDVKMMTFQAYRDNPSTSQGMVQLDLETIR
jgi:hypothetical protein